MVIRFEDHEDLLSSQAFNVTTITNSDVDRSRWVEFWNADSIRDVVEHIWDRELEQFGKLDLRIQVRSRGDMGRNYSWLSPPICMLKSVEACDTGYGETHRSLVCVHMASENDVDLRFNNPFLEHHPHRFTFHVVVGVGVVPGRVHQHKQPGGYIPVHSCKLLLQPSPLWGILPCNIINRRHQFLQFLSNLIVAATAIGIHGFYHTF